MSGQTVKIHLRRKKNNSRAPPKSSAGHHIVVIYCTTCPWWKPRRWIWRRRWSRGARTQCRRSRRQPWTQTKVNKTLPKARRTREFSAFASNCPETATKINGDSRYDKKNLSVAKLWKCWYRAVPKLFTAIQMSLMFSTTSTPANTTINLW